MPGKSLPLDQITFPIKCPDCKASAGMPYKAVTSPDAVYVELRCRDCRREWQFEMPVKVAPLPNEPESRKGPGPTWTVIPKADRRKGNL